MSEHLEENAEMYVLDLLDEPERLAAEQHAAACPACTRRMKEAREDVTRIESARAHFDPPERLGRRLRGSVHPGASGPHRWIAALAVAAAFAVALVPTWVSVDRDRALRSAMSADEQALARIASATHFGDATFVAHGNRPMGKVLYGMHGDWYYVVIVNPRPRMQVAYVHGGRLEMLGSIAMHGSSGTLYLPVNHRMDELALLESGAPVAHAHLVY